MNRLTTCSVFAAVALTLLFPPVAGRAGEPFVADGEPGSFGYEFASRLYYESLPAAAAYAEQSIDSEGAPALFAKGITDFLFAVEGLAQDLHRYGMKDPVFDVPILRLPIRPNTEPELLGYGDLRAIQQRFLERLAVADESLRAIESGDFTLLLRPSGALIDLDGDGSYSVHERLDLFLLTVVGLSPLQRGETWDQYRDRVEMFVGAVRAGNDEALAELDQVAPLFGFDAADAYWLRGYVNLLSAMMEILLAHDWELSFDNAAQAFFENVETPFPDLAEAYRTRGYVSSIGVETQLLALGLDLAAFAIHSPWRTTEPQRMRKAREHLKEMIVTSRASWALINAESDNAAGTDVTANEWIPNPRQEQWLSALPVRVQTVDGWQAFLDTFDRVLDGELLIPHWRFEQGINVRRMFEEPQELSPILILQGTAVMPYLEDGPMADGAHMQPILALLDGNLFGYMIWFN